MRKPSKRKEPGMTGASFKSSALVFCLLALAGFGVYANSLEVPFYLDDFRNIGENRHIRIETLSPSSLFDAAVKSPIKTRPVSNLSFSLNYFFHQEKVFGYHLVNILIHILAAFAAYLVFSATLKTPAMSELQGNGRDLLPLLAALLWLVHPLHTGSVTYIVQRMITLATLLYMLSLLSYIKGRMAETGRKWIWYACSLLTALLAVGSKEIAVTLPFVIFLYEWFFFQNLDRRWMQKRLWGVGLLVLLLIVLSLIYGGSITDLLLADYTKRPFTVTERVLTEFRVVILYLSLLAFPHPGRLNLDHDIGISHSLLDPATTSFSLLAIVLLLLVAVLAAKKQRLLAFAILWFLGNLVLESSFVGLELIFEHRTYLPSIFVVFVSAYLVLQYIRPRRLSVGMLIGAVAVSAWWTVQRNQVWQDPVLFWSDSAAKSPHKARPHMNLSVALREAGRIDEAIRTSQKAVALDPRYVNGYVGLATAYAEKGDLQKAESAYLAALEKMPDYAGIYNALGVLYIRQGRYGEAIAAFDENIRLDPSDINALVNRASVRAILGQHEQAITDFEQALKLDAKNGDILFNLALAYTENGEYAEAIRSYEKVLRINPDDREARVKLRQLQAQRHQ